MTSTPMETEKVINPLIITKILLYSNSLIWMIISIITLFRLNAENDEKIPLYSIVAMLAFVNGILLAVCATYINKNKLIIWFSLLLVGINALLSITDDLGIVDVCIFLFNFVTFTLIIIYRNKFLLQKHDDIYRSTDG
jgi:hypothetical protein